MILGRETHVHAACFDEIDTAVKILNLQHEDHDRVCFNAHAFPELLPPDAIVYNLENVGIQLPPTFWPGHEIWDFSELNVEAWRKAGRKVTHVPIGYHPSMERFEPKPWAERDIDVVFSGAMNARRFQALDDMRARGLNVVHVPPTLYGPGRDSLLARAKLGLNMLYYPGGTFPALRVAHLVANRVPVLSERCPEAWGFIEQVPLEKLALHAYRTIRQFPARLEMLGDTAYHTFRLRPMVLP